MSDPVSEPDDALDCYIASLPEAVEKAERIPAGLAARWTLWADDLQNLMDRIPVLPRFLDWMGDDGRAVMDLDLDHIGTEDIRQRLARVRSEADAAAGMYGRASLEMVRRHGETLKSFGVDRRTEAE